MSALALVHGPSGDSTQTDCSDRPAATPGPWSAQSARPLRSDELPEPEPLPLVRPARRRDPVRANRSPLRGGYGQLIGHRYRLEGFLGEGGTATVHLATDLETRGQVVIKRMKAEVAQEPELRHRFVMEAQTLSAIDHPLVVRALDVDEPEGEAPFLVLEALAGETLGDYLRRQEVVDVEIALAIVRDAAEALAAVHEAGVVHRDIKPDNLFLCGPKGRASSVKVLDFGMAHFDDEHADENSTSILGTAQYMAPEQILVEPVDARTDVYGLGVVLFRMLTGHLPFDARSKTDLLRHQLFSPVPPATWLNEDLPEAVAQLVRGATQKCPERRPATMESFLADLVAVQSALAEGCRPSESELDWEDYETDVYLPKTDRGRKAAAVLAREFGRYSRPHSPMPPTAL